MMNCGKSKNIFPGLQHNRCGCCFGSDRIKASQGRRFDWRSEVEESLHRPEEASQVEEALALQPLSQQTVKQPGKVALALSSHLHVLSGQRDVVTSLSFIRSASAFAPASESLSFCEHNKKENLQQNRL
jgi:hypothetical protein